MQRITREDAKALGFIVDETCYPWLAYKGPRFRPHESHEVWTDEEARMLEEIKVLRQYGNKDCTAMADDELETRRSSRQTQIGY